ncbi:hypothetical protein OH77DRAFT_959275 [Trametes cingulata]|nr:hypothetical protein OH77DRAFT_959275 [Trametes cingulata]
MLRRYHCTIHVGRTLDFGVCAQPGLCRALYMTIGLRTCAVEMRASPGTRGLLPGTNVRAIPFATVRVILSEVETLLALQSTRNSRSTMPLQAQPLCLQYVHKYAIVPRLQAYRVMNSTASAMGNPSETCAWLRGHYVASDISTCDDICHRQRCLAVPADDLQEIAGHCSVPSMLPIRRDAVGA